MLTSILKICPERGWYNYLRPCLLIIWRVSKSERFTFICIGLEVRLSIKTFWIFGLGWFKDFSFREWGCFWGLFCSILVVFGGLEASLSRLGGSSVSKESFWSSLKRASLSMSNSNICSFGSGSFAGFKISKTFSIADFMELFFLVFCSFKFWGILAGGVVSSTGNAFFRGWIGVLFFGWS